MLHVAAALRGLAPAAIVAEIERHEFQPVVAPDAVAAQHRPDLVGPVEGTQAPPHPVPGIEQHPGDMAADKPRNAGDEDGVSHSLPLPRG